MLSLSADNSRKDVDLRIINGEGDGGVPFGEELSQFAEAIARRDDAALATSREALQAAGGDAVLVDAAAVAGNFQRMVRIADATGIPLDGIASILSSGVQDELGLRRFHSAQNTPPLILFHKLLHHPVRLLAKLLLRSPR